MLNPAIEYPLVSVNASGTLEYEMSKVIPFFVTIVASRQYNIGMDKWSIAHRYKKLVEAGIATPLTAPDGIEYILKADKNYEPVYWHSVLDTYMVPGAAWWMETQSKIDKYDLDTLSYGML